MDVVVLQQCRYRIRLDGRRGCIVKENGNRKRNCRQICTVGEFVWMNGQCKSVTAGRPTVFFVANSHLIDGIEGASQIRIVDDVPPPFTKDKSWKTSFVNISDDVDLDIARQP
jgi:hypothetical protein